MGGEVQFLARRSYISMASEVRNQRLREIRKGTSFHSLRENVQRENMTPLLGIGVKWC